MIFATDNEAGHRILGHLYNRAASEFPKMRSEVTDRRRGFSLPTLFDDLDGLEHIGCDDNMQVPAAEIVADRLLMRAKHGEVKIEVWPGLFTEEEIDRASASNHPWHVEIAKQLSRIRRHVSGVHLSVSQARQADLLRALRRGVRRTAFRWRIDMKAENKRLAFLESEAFMQPVGGFPIRT
jgi:hypothetical protein